MAMNPIQKERNNATIIGAIIGLVMGIALAAVVVIILKPDILNFSGGATEPQQQAAVLNKDITSGTQITEADVTISKVRKSMIPSDAVSTITVGSTAKIDLKANTVLSASMLNAPGTTSNAELREQEYNMIALPTLIKAGDFIDVRFVSPSGQDFIVVSKKRVENANSTSVWLKMTEEETIIMSNAIVEYYIMTGSKLYADKYTDAGIQTASVPTYVPNSSVLKLINENVTNTNIKQLTEGRYAEGLRSLRASTINNDLGDYSEKRLENLETRLQEEIKNLKEARAAYLNALTAEQSATK